MVGVDAPQDARHLVARVAVRVDRVVHEAGVDLVVAQRPLVAERLVGPPLLAGVDLRARGVGRRLEVEPVLGQRLAVLGCGHRLLRVRGRGVDRSALGRGPGRHSGLDHGQLHAGGRYRLLADRTHLHPVDLADEQDIRAGARVPPLLAVRVGLVVVVVGQLRPVGPGAVLEGAGLEGELLLVVVRLHGPLASSRPRRCPGVPGHAHGAVPGHLLGAAGHRGHAPVRGRTRSGARLERARRDPRARRGRECVLLHLGVDHLVRQHRRPAGFTGVRREAGRGPVGGSRAVAGRLPDHVEADHARRGGQGSDHHAQGQQLLAGGDETGLSRTHSRLLQCGGRFTRVASFTSVTLVTARFLSNYIVVISSRHAECPLISSESPPDVGSPYPPDRSTAAPERALSSIALPTGQSLVGVLLESLERLLPRFG